MRRHVCVAGRSGVMQVLITSDRLKMEKGVCAINQLAHDKKMALATLKEVLDFAKKRTCAIGMFNVVNMEYAEAIVQASEELNFPVILGFPEVFFNFHPLEETAEFLIHSARKSAVPTVVHLDHGGSFDMIMKVMKLGFTSVMFDGSALKFEENIRQTAEIVRIAHAMGVSVEGELGYLGFEAVEGDVAEGSSSLDLIDHARLTSPEQAQEFEECTGVDALAIAIGNMHGHYRGTPKLDLKRLEEIKKVTQCGLVLHGGSGLSDSSFKDATDRGIRKINIHTSMSDFVLAYLRKNVPDSASWLELANDLRIELRNYVKEMIRLFGRMD